MTTDLKALAHELEAISVGGLCVEENEAVRDRAASILRTLADADAKMPVVAYRYLHDEDDELLTESPLVRQSDAQAAILAATERAEKDAKAEKDAARYRWLRAQDNDDFCFAVVKNPHFDVYEPAELDAAIDQHLGEKP